LGSGGLGPSGVQRQSPWLEDQYAKPPEAQSFLAFTRPKERQICPILVWQMTN